MKFVPQWTTLDLEILRRGYASAVVDLDTLAALIGRHKTNICRKARELGLTNQARPKQSQPTLPFNAPSQTAEELRERRSRAAVLRLERNGHPRGMLGKKHTAETLAVLGDRSRASWAKPGSKLRSPEETQRRSDLMVARVAAGKMRGGGYSRGAGGRREDLAGRYFRSSWEANYARLLNWMMARGELVSWEYEPKTFVFEAIRRGTRAYTPDFKVTFSDGQAEWHEVKGWLDQKSRTRLKRMAKYFPQEKIVLRDARYFAAIGRGPLPALIPHWERKPRRGAGPSQQATPNVRRSR